MHASSLHITVPIAMIFKEYNVKCVSIECYMVYCTNTCTACTVIIIVHGLLSIQV